MNLANKPNQYQQAIAPALFDTCPKAVFAAIAVSFLALQSGDSFEFINGELLREWEVLHKQGIVPQAPPKSLMNKYPTNEKF